MAGSSQIMLAVEGKPRVPVPADCVVGEGVRDVAGLREAARRSLLAQTETLLDQDVLGDEDLRRLDALEGNLSALREMSEDVTFECSARNGDGNVENRAFHRIDEGLKDLINEAAEVSIDISSHHAGGR